ncbi:hypothetical protein SAY87_019015 [Trapa incisa]|uniref:Uncharacterized protein n=1 Tax=Trapa incisa TaxID=236973 RepID=A0AAN7Q247_9MYRT|nr:hypothetical protein SAY87_019015 [Trapa incisa]
MHVTERERERSIGKWKERAEEKASSVLITEISDKLGTETESSLPKADLGYSIAEVMKGGGKRDSGGRKRKRTKRTRLADDGMDG